MAVSPILEILALTEAQAQKTTAINNVLQALEAALAARYELDCSAATTVGFNVTIPYNNANDLSDRTALRFIVLELTGNPTQNFDVVHPPKPHLFVVKNSTVRDATIHTGVFAGETVLLSAGASKLVYSIGNVAGDILELSFTPETIKQAVDYGFSYYSQPEASVVMGRTIVSRQVTFPANFAGSSGTVGVNPLAVKTLELYAGVTKIGEVTVSTVGNVSFSTVGATSKVVNAGTALELRNIASFDTLFDTIEIVLLGTIVVTQ